MRKETFTQYLLRRLDGAAGMHSRIAKESGVGQATISRIYLRKASPRLESAEAILAWFERHDRKEARKKSASGVSSGANTGRSRAAAAATPALRQ